MIPLCPCMCALYQGIWFQVVSKTVPVFPNVRQTMWRTDRGAKPYLEHLFCWLSRCKGWLTRFSRFGALLMTAQNYTHKWYCGKRFAARDMVGGRKRQSLTLCWSLFWVSRSHDTWGPGALQPSLPDLWLIVHDYLCPNIQTSPTASFLCRNNYFSQRLFFTLSCQPSQIQQCPCKLCY